MKVVSVAQMRALEAAASAAGVTEAELQQRAGTRVAEDVAHLLEPDQRVTVLVGHGNNGRDGGVAAEWLLRHGWRVDLVLAPRHALRADELARLQAAGAALIPGGDSFAVERALSAASVVLDALTGIGAKGPLREPLASLARQANAARRGAGAKLVALDVPSGIDADTGDCPGEVVEADVTVTLGAVKQGLLRLPAAEHVGRLIPRSLGLDDAGLPYALLDEVELRQLVPDRPLAAHKYKFGRVLVIAGTDHFPGAAALCCGGALRVGAGLVTLGTMDNVRPAVAARTPEVTYTLSEVRATDGAMAARALKPYLRSHTAIVLGPGLGRGPAVTEFVRELLALRPREHSLTLDADGLIALSEIADWSSLVDRNMVLTPHSGELARLVGQPLSDAEPVWVQTGRLAAAWGCVLVAKGPFTCIANADGRVAVWPRPNPALATGGTGDVLAGVTAGLLAQSGATWDAARLAVGLHGLAAERVLNERGWRTLVASDLLDALPAALGSLARPTRRR